MILYKYRNLENLRFLIDIFMNQRLYAAHYTEMNDPMEGHYFHRSGSLNPEFKSALKGEKSSYGICSLSEIANNDLMWAHYAGGHTGICIGVEVCPNKYEIEKVMYDGLSALTNKLENEPAEAAKRVLSHKLEIWDYEEEHRVFVQYSKFVELEIKEVIFGRRAKDKDFYKKLILAFCPNVIFKEELEL